MAIFGQKDGAEIVAEHTIDGRAIVVYGCYSKDTAEGAFDFFDLYDANGECLNMGDPFDTCPNAAEIKAYLDTKAE